MTVLGWQTILGFIAAQNNGAGHDGSWNRETCEMFVPSFGQITTIEY